MSTEKCPKCGSEHFCHNSIFGCGPWHFCKSCHARFVEIDGKMRELELNSDDGRYILLNNAPWYEEDDSHSRITDDMISLNIAVIEKDKPPAYEDLVGQEVTEAYSRNLTERYKPVLVNGSWLVLGELFGIRITRRGLEQSQMLSGETTDNSVMMQYLSEDDGTWFVGVSTLNAYWMEDMAKVVGIAYDFLKGSGYFTKGDLGEYTFN